jgi:hypothetical protein
MIGSGLPVIGGSTGYAVRRIGQASEGLGARPDLLVVAAEAIDAPLLAFLDEDRHQGIPIILLTDTEGADAVGALLGHRVMAFLPMDEPGEQLAQAIGQHLARRIDVADSGQAIGLPLHDRVEALRLEAERVARALGTLLAEREDDAAGARPVDAARIRAHIKARRLRERFFPADLFADPAWDIMLDLAAARRSGLRVSVSSLCIAAAVPTTTALRWIKAMVDRGMLVREADPADARRAFITLSEPTATALDACLEACFNLPGL